MDALSEVLQVIRLDSAIYFNAEFSEPSCLASSESRMLVPDLGPGAAFEREYGSPPARDRREQLADKCAA